jgi:thioredoxin 2
MSTDTGTAGTVVCEHCGHKNRVPAAAAGKPTCGHCHEPLPWIVDAGEHDFAEVAERATMPVLVDLWATWCGPCRQVSPALAQLARERAGKVKLVKVDVDQAPALSQRFDVKAVPTLMVLRGGEVVARQPGAAPVNVLREWLDQALARSGNPAKAKSSRAGDVR